MARASQHTPDHKTWLRPQRSANDGGTLALVHGLPFKPELPLPIPCVLGEDDMGILMIVFVPTWSSTDTSEP